MPNKYDLEHYLRQLRKIEEHREVGCEAKVRKIYQELLADLQGFLGKTYSELAIDDKLTYEILHSKGQYARFLEEVEQRINTFTPEAAREIRDTVDATYSACYNGMQDAVINSKSREALAKNLKGLTAVTPDVIKRAVENPITGLTLNDTLEKNRRQVIYDIKQQIGIGLSQGDRMSTMARRISEKLDMDYKKAIRIVRTETHRVREAGFQDASERIAENLNDDWVMTKTWKTMQDEAVRPQRRYRTKSGWKYSARMNGPNHMKMHGVTVLVDELFDLGDGSFAKAPGQSGVAGHDINCRCYLSRDLMTKAEFAKLTGRKFEDNSVEKIAQQEKKLEDEQSELRDERERLENEIDELGQKYRGVSGARNIRNYDAATAKIQRAQIQRSLDDARTANNEKMVAFFEKSLSEFDAFIQDSERYLQLKKTLSQIDIDLESIDDELKVLKAKRYELQYTPKPVAQCTKDEYYKLSVAAEPKITKDLQEIVDQTNGELTGLDFRLKTKDSYDRKVQKEIGELQNEFNKRHIDYVVTEQDAVSQMRDTVRYTRICKPETFVSEYNDTINLLEDRGYTVVRVKNTFKPGESYKGVNTIVRTPDGYDFELQFHTQESFDAKNGILHELYEKQRVSDSAEEIAELGEQMRKISDAIVSPDDIDNIAPFNTFEKFVDKQQKDYVDYMYEDIAERRKEIADLTDEVEKIKSLKSIRVYDESFEDWFTAEDYLTDPDYRRMIDKHFEYAKRDATRYGHDEEYERYKKFFDEINAVQADPGALKRREQLESKLKAKKDELKPLEADFKDIASVKLNALEKDLFDDLDEEIEELKEKVNIKTLKDIKYPDGNYTGIDYVEKEEVRELVDYEIAKIQRWIDTGTASDDNIQYYDKLVKFKKDVEGAQKHTTYLEYNVRDYVTDEDARKKIDKKYKSLKHLKEMEADVDWLDTSIAKIEAIRDEAVDYEKNLKRLEALKEKRDANLYRFEELSEKYGLGRKQTIYEGKDLSNTYRYNRNTSEFKHAIEDVIHEQGFDNLPAIVSKQRFEEICAKNTQPRLYRTFSGATQEELEAFDDMLLNGKWYVDCGTGGAQYGQGMYCAGVYKNSYHTIEEGLAEMEDYIDLNKDRGKSFSIIKEMTLDDSAKIISYDDIFDMRNAYTIEQPNILTRKFITDATDNENVRALLLQQVTNDTSRPFEELMEVYHGLSDDEMKIYKTLLVDSRNFKQDRIMEQADLDIGVFAAMRGYDAINAIGHGRSGSYTVVLNRSKLIIRRD